jgi:exosortase E/protease (VPEID-CTERM system)
MTSPRMPAGSAAPSPEPAPSEASAPRRWGLALAGALLLGEFMWLVNRFTTEGLKDCPEEWARLMHGVKSLPQIGLLLVTALLLFRRTETIDGIHERPWQRSRSRWTALVAAQLLAFALLYRSSAGIFDERLAGVRFPLIALGAWVALVAATAGLGVLFFQPLPALLGGLSRRAGFLLGASFVGVTAWLVGHFAADEMSQPLRGPTLWLSSNLLQLFEPDSFSDTARFYFGTERFYVEIAPACSGFEGMGLMLVFASAYTWISRGELRFPRALLLPLAGIAVVWLLNVLRLVALVLIGTHVSVDLAMGGFHGLAGTLAFCVAALGLVAVARRSTWLTIQAESRAAGHERDGTAAYLTPFLLTIALGMILGAFGESGRVLEPLKSLAAAAALWLFWRQYAIELRPAWIPALLLGALAFVAWVAIPNSSPAQTSSTLLAVRVASCLCIEPLVEELAFRGYLMRRLSSSEFESLGAGQVSILAWGVSSLAFGAVHGHWIASTICGAAYGFAYMRRGRIVDAVLAHTCTNVLLVGLAALRGDWSMV